MQEKIVHTGFRGSLDHPMRGSQEESCAPALFGETELLLQQREKTKKGTLAPFLPLTIDHGGLLPSRL